MSRLTPSEQAVLTSVANSAANLAVRLTDSITKFVGALRASRYLDKQEPAFGTVPDQLRDEVQAYAVWEWLCDFPALKALKTDERKRRYDLANDVYRDICTKDYGSIEPPEGLDKTGAWNSWPKLVGRMQSPPPPPSQLTAVYANPNALTDSLAVLATPRNTIGYAGPPQLNPPDIDAIVVDSVGRVWLWFPDQAHPNGAWH